MFRRPAILCRRPRPTDSAAAMKEKGEIYVSQLYHHLDNEVWDLAPNLHHKVQKHAPERICKFFHALF